MLYLNSPEETNLSCVQVYSIRDAAAHNLEHLAEEFGPDWSMQHIIPQVCLMIPKIKCY